MARAIALLVLVAGCDVAFGLDPLELEVTGRYMRQYEYNTPTRTPVLEQRPFTAADVTFSARSESGEPIEVDFEYADGTFSFRPPALRYRLLADYAGSRVDLELQLTTTYVNFVDTFSTRPDAAPPVPGTTITGTISGASGPNTHLITTGLWTDNALLGAPGSYSLDWPHSLISGSGFDRLYFTRFETLEQGLVITQFATHDTLDMVGGTANSVDVTLAPIPQPYCAHLLVARNAELARLQTAQPNFEGRGGTAWGIYASPNLELGVHILLGIAYDGTGSCEDCTFHYSSPFAGFETLSNIGAQRGRQVVGLPFMRYAGTTVFDRIEQSVTCDTYQLRDSSVAIATDIQLGSTLLETDGVEFVRAAGSAQLAWQDDGAPVDAYRIDVVEATDQSTFGTSLRRIYTTDRRVAIDWDLFEAGRPYAFIVRAFIGLPGAATGDFERVAYPYGESYVTSAVFYVR